MTILPRFQAGGLDTGIAARYDFVDGGRWVKDGVDGVESEERASEHYP